MTARKTKAQKARSAAARKGWETRREKVARAAVIDHIPDAVKSSLIDYRVGLGPIRSCAREMVWGDLRQPDPPAPPPICTDCKYIWYSSDAPRLARCAAPQLSKRSPVDGSLHSDHDVATVNRAYQHLCGARGRFFSPKGPPAAPSPQEQALRQIINISNDRALLYDEAKVLEACSATNGFIPIKTPPTFLQRILRWFR